MSTMTSKGQVTVPKAIRDQLGLKPGKKVVFRLEKDGRATIAPAGPVKAPASRFRKLRGTATATLSTDEIMALTRGD